MNDHVPRQMESFDLSIQSLTCILSSAGALHLVFDIVIVHHSIAISISFFFILVFPHLQL